MIELIVLGSIQATVWGGIAIVKLVKKYKKRNSPRNNVQTSRYESINYRTRNTRTNNDEPLPIYVPEPPKYSLCETNDLCDLPPAYSVTVISTN